MNRLFTSNQAVALLVALLMSISLGTGLTLAQSDLNVSWFTVSGGGGASSSGPFQVQGTLGQAVAAAPATGGDFQLQSGFWAGVDKATTPTGQTYPVYLPLISRK